jgi:hypothetical protein
LLLAARRCCAAAEQRTLGDFDLRVMQNFRVLAHGQGMVVRRWLFFRRHVGFYATRFVEAATAEDAGAQVLAQLQGEARIILAAVEAPVLTIEEVEAIDGPIGGLPEPGIVFYPTNAHKCFRWPIQLHPSCSGRSSAADGGDAPATSKK